MNKKKILLHSLLHATAIVAYVILVAFIMNAGSEFFDEANQTLTSIGVLLLFTVSAAITGLLVFGRPVFLFLNGQKQEAIYCLGYTLGWLFALTIIFLLFLAIFN